MARKLELTSRRKIAVDLMVEIALQGRDTAVPLSRVAAEIDVSMSTLEHLSADLRRGGLIRGFKGPGGGYMLAKPAAEISISDIGLRTKDWPAARSNEEQDALESWCPQTRNLWDEMEKCQYLLLRHISLADVLHGDIEGHSFLKRMRDACNQGSLL